MATLIETIPMHALEKAEALGWKIYDASFNPKERDKPAVDRHIVMCKKIDATLDTQDGLNTCQAAQAELRKEIYGEDAEDSISHPPIAVIKRGRTS